MKLIKREKGFMDNMEQMLGKLKSKVQVKQKRDVFIENMLVLWQKKGKSGGTRRNDCGTKDNEKKNKVCITLAFI